MARRKETKNQTETVPLLEIPVNSDLAVRIQKISEQTGLPSLNLLQKWILQEESWIGLTQRNGEQQEQVTKQEKAARPKVSRRQVSDVQKQEKQKKTAKNAPSDSPDYGKTLAERARKLKEEGMTLVKMAEIFNSEKLPTASGKGKWYPSSLVRLLNSKA
jgi:hypothetical protein